MDKIAVLIPCYNEALSIGKVVNDAKKVLPDATVYVYDNNSTDETVKCALEAGAIVKFEYKQGKGNVIRRMFREIDAECYIMVDGDDTYELDSAGKMADLVLNHNADMVVGDRLSSTYFTENKRPFHNFGNNIVRFAINKLFKCDIRDIMTGYRAFSYQFAKAFPVLSKGFEIETEMTIFAVNNNLQVENVVIHYRDRQEGSVSKLNTYSDGIKVLGTISRMFREYRPLPFFSSLALILTLLSLIFLIPVLIEWNRTGMVPRFPTLIVCGFAIIAAIQSLFTGLILHNISIKNRIDTEMKINELQKDLSFLKNKH